MLSDFTVDQLQKVATKFGCVGVGSKSKFDVRMAMSIKLTVHNRICRTSVFQADEETCSRNTGIRMQNATFHAEHRKQFIMSNDIKKRKDFVRGARRNGENLYASISNMVNDCECNEDIGKAKIPNDPTNHYIAEATIEQGLDPTNSLPTTGKGVTNYLKKCIKGRAAIQSLMRESGQNSHDAMSYVKRAISKANICGLSNIELYYFHERAREVPDMDAAFWTFLTDKLKCDTAQDMDACSRISNWKSSPKDSLTKSVSSVLDSAENVMQEMLSGMKDSQAERKMRDTEEYKMLKADNERKKVAHEMKKVAHKMLKADNERKMLVHEMMKEDNERKCGQTCCHIKQSVVATICS